MERSCLSGGNMLGVKSTVILHHGLMGFDRLRLGPVKYNNWRGIDAAIAALNCDVFTTRVHPTASVATRAEQLARQVRNVAARQGSRVILVAHSMGGLDARYAIGRLGLDADVMGLVTICTPHRGSAYADRCALKLGRDMKLYRMLGKVGVDVSAAMDLTRESCGQFNLNVADVPTVRYFSVGSAPPRSAVMPLLLRSHRIIFEEEGDNDGLVSVASSRWGEYLGTWAGDHFMCINKRYALRPAVRSVPVLYQRVLEQVLSLDLGRARTP